MTWTAIVGKKFTVPDFAAYVKSLDLKHAQWSPAFCVLHNTSEPSLAEYAKFSARKISDEQWLQNLASFYRGKGWQAGPHLFIVPSGILVFTPLTHRGTHSPSWNYCSWGIEMTGEYQTEDFNSGDGAKVRDNAVQALAILHDAVGLSPVPYLLGKRGLHFHKEDRLTTHDTCPGKNVVKADIVARLGAALAAMNPNGHPDGRAEVMAMAGAQS